MWQQTSIFVVFVSSICIAIAKPSSFSRFDPDRLMEDVYRLKGFAENPVNIAGPGAWKTVLDGFQKFNKDDFYDLPALEDEESMDLSSALSDADLAKLLPQAEFESLRSELAKRAHPEQQKAKLS